MKRSPSFNRLVLLLCAVMLALTVLTAQIVILTQLPTLAASLSLPGRGVLQQTWERAHDALDRLSSAVPRAGLSASWEQVRARVPAALAAPSPEREVQAAWRRAQEAGIYHFTTRIVQTTHPAPRIANVGRGSRVETLFLDGDADLPAETLLMRLWQNGGSITNPADAAEIRIEGQQAYGRVHNGSWQEIDNFATGFAPGNDAMGFLVAARNVDRVAGSGGRPDVSPSTLNASRFTFNLDGPALAEHIRAQLEEHLRQNGELPLGVHLDTPDQLRATIGNGEVWVDSDGLPLRLTIHVEYPQQRNGERIEADIYTDFSNFNREAIASLQPPILRLRSGQASDPSASLRTSLQSPISNLQSLISNLQSKARESETLLSLSSFMGLLLLTFTHSRSKKVYAALVIVVIVSMVITPLLQSAQVHAFTQKQAAQQAEYDQEQEAQEAAREIQDVMYGSDWNPHTDPLASEQAGKFASERVGESASQPFTIHNSQFTIHNSPVLLSPSESNPPPPPSPTTTATV